MSRKLAVLGARLYSHRGGANPHSTAIAAVNPATRLRANPANLNDDPAPLNRQSYLLDQLAARQFGIAGPTLVEPRDGYKQTSSQVGQCGGGDKGQRLTASVGADC